MLKVKFVVLTDLRKGARPHNIGGWEGASLGEEKMRAGAYIAVPTGRSGFAGFNDLSGLGGVGAAWSCLMPGRGAIREGDGMLAQSWESLLEEGGRELWFVCCD